MGGTPSIGLTLSHVAEVLCKLTLTLFFINTISILARKFFPEVKLLNVYFRPNRTLDDQRITTGRYFPSMFALKRKR